MKQKKGDREVKEVREEKKRNKEERADTASRIKVAKECTKLFSPFSVRIEFLPCSLFFVS